MRKTKIVCTIGPASETIEKLTELIEAGMNVARLNFSHGDFEEHGARIENIRKAGKTLGKDIAILLDTKGPEIRTRTVENGSIELVAGADLIVSMEDIVGNTEKISVTYEDLIDDVEVGSTILLDDGLIGLEVKEINMDRKEIVTKVMNTGTLKNKKGVNVPGVSVNLPGITEKDANDILFELNKASISSSLLLLDELLMCLKFVSFLKRIMRLTFKSFLRLKTKRVLITSMKSLRYQMV